MKQIRRHPRYRIKVNQNMKDRENTSEAPTFDDCIEYSRAHELKSFKHLSISHRKLYLLKRCSACRCHRSSMHSLRVFVRNSQFHCNSEYDCVLCCAVVSKYRGLFHNSRRFVSMQGLFGPTMMCYNFPCGISFLCAKVNFSFQSRW